MSLLTDAIAAFNTKLDNTITSINGVNSTINTRAAVVAANTIAAKASEDAAKAFEATALASKNTAVATQTAINDIYYGARSSDPTTKPSGAAMAVGDEYFSTSANLLKRWNGATWQASDINTANLAAPGGALLIGALQSGLGAIARTQKDKNQESISLADFGGSPLASAAVNNAAFSSALAYLETVGGGELNVGPGDHTISATILSATAGIHIKLSHSTGILYGSSLLTAVKLMGASCSVTGGKGRGFIGPAIWDGTNTAPTYGVIWMGGNYGYVNTRLLNVRKMGIWFKDVFDGTAEGCIIEANYPSGQWTNVETGHFGVMFDPSSGLTAGNFRLAGNTIKDCVQGCMPANYGGGGVVQGFVATGNVFEGCFNHGIYCNTAYGAQITGNVFNRCQIAAVLAGDGNSFIGNTSYSAATSAADARDVVGVSVRDGSRNIVAYNTFKGVLEAVNAVCIDVRNVVGGANMNDNLVVGNTIEITAGLGIAIRVQATGANTCSGNIVQGNTIKLLGAQYLGGISVFADVATGNIGNKVEGNQITLKGDSWGVYATNQTAGVFRGNVVEYAWDSGAAVSLNTVALSVCVGCTVEGNASVVRPAWGTNLYIYGLREFGACAGNRLSRSVNSVSLTKAAGFGVNESVGTGLLVDESGPGEPVSHAAIGSTWRRTDGAPGTSFYIKESGTTSAGWLPTGWKSGAAAYDPASLAAGATQQTTVAVPGAFVGDMAAASFSVAHADILWLASVTATNTVTATMWNRGVSAVDLAAGTLKVQART